MNWVRDPCSSSRNSRKIPRHALLVAGSVHGLGWVLTSDERAYTKKEGDHPSHRARILHGGICKSGTAFIPRSQWSLAALLAPGHVCPFSSSLLLLILITHHRDSSPESRFGPSLTNAPASIDGHFPDEVKKHAQIGTAAQSSLADCRRGLRRSLLVDAISRSSTNIHSGTVR